MERCCFKDKKKTKTVSPKGDLLADAHILIVSVTNCAMTLVIEVVLVSVCV